MALRPGRERPEKILLAMHDLTSKGSGFLKYEDIVVRAFEMFPDEFALRGYPQYPDSSDIHKPLYGVLKKQGLVRSANKAFALTPLGLERAERMGKGGTAKDDRPRTADRLDRAEELEVERVVKSAAFTLFASGQRARVLDTDFYAFFGCTVRTSKNDFLGRMSATREAITRAKKLGKPDPATAKLMSDLLRFLQDEFKSEITGKAGANA